VSGLPFGPVLALNEGHSSGDCLTSAVGLVQTLHSQTGKSVGGPDPAISADVNRGTSLENEEHGPAGASTLRRWAVSRSGGGILA
jgi:hypothetical protein